MASTLGRTAEHGQIRIGTFKRCLKTGENNRFLGNLTTCQISLSRVISDFLYSVHMTWYFGQVTPEKRMKALPNDTWRHRKGHGLTQHEMAFLLGSKDGSAVSHVERGAREPSLRSALACEVMFGVPARELFPGIYEEVETEVKTRAQALAEKSTGRRASYKKKLIEKILSPNEPELAQAV